MYPRRYKKKDPFECSGSRKDRWCCMSPCSGQYVHFTLGEPHEDPSMYSRIVRSLQVSETSEVMVWYAQVMGKPWCAPGPFPRTLSIQGIQVEFEEAFSRWRRLWQRGGESAQGHGGEDHVAL